VGRRKFYAYHRVDPTDPNVLYDFYPPSKKSFLWKTRAESGCLYRRTSIRKYEQVPCIPIQYLYCLFNQAKMSNTSDVKIKQPGTFFESRYASSLNDIKGMNTDQGLQNFLIGNLNYGEIAFYAIPDFRSGC
jgi:hypothetical protein